MLEIGIELFTGSIDFITAFFFLLLAYKFSTLAKLYAVAAFNDLSLGFRFMFLSYLLPFLSLFIGMVVFGDLFETIAFLFIGVPATACTIIAFWYFFKSVKAFIAFAKQAAES